MKKRCLLNLNKRDTKIAFLVSIIFLLITAGISYFISCAALQVAFSEIIDLLSVFSLTFMGFLLTAFTFIQILQSKEWFNSIRKTNGFDQLISSFRVLILGCIGCFFAALLLKIAISLICGRIAYIVTISLSVWAISFLIVLSWKTVETLIELFKA
jgi:hypothetical protein